MILLIGSTSFLDPAVLKKLLDNNYDGKCFLRPRCKIYKIKKAAEKKQKKILFS